MQSDSPFGRLMVFACIFLSRNSVQMSGCPATDVKWSIYLYVGTNIMPLEVTSLWQTWAYSANWWCGRGKRCSARGIYTCV